MQATYGHSPLARLLTMWFQWGKQMDVVLGGTYRDKITGFTGTCTGRCAYISGCDQALLVPKVGEDGPHKEGHWYDIQRLEALDAPVVVLDNGLTPGCDMAAPKG